MFEGGINIFTLFVLVVSIFLSFVLRNLIQEIQTLKEDLSMDLRSFTRELVEDHPTLERYLKLGILFFKNEEHENALEFFERLIEERVFLREALFYQILCLVELGRKSEARSAFESLDPVNYSRSEMNQLQLAFAYRGPLVRIRDFFVRVLLTHVPFQYGPASGHLADPKEREMQRILAGLPTRYTKVQFQQETELGMSCSAIDKHLSREVQIEVARENLTQEQMDRFFDYPRILARLHSRFFPEVYDLQQTGIVFFSLEKFEGQELHPILSEHVEAKRLVNILRLWISILSRVEFLHSVGAMMDPFDLKFFGIHKLRENLFCWAKLKKMAPEEFHSQEKAVRDLFVHVVQKCSDGQKTGAEVQKSLDEALKEAKTGSLLNLTENLERALDRILYAQQSDIRLQLEQLTILEKVHRSSIHGLKGKFAIVQRYREEPEKLLRTFFRESNVQDVEDKLKRLGEMLQELISSMNQNPLPMSEELAGLEVRSITEDMRDYFERSAQGRSKDSGLDFLKEQYERFNRLSDHLSEFISFHEVNLATYIQTYLPKTIEPSKIEVDCSPESLVRKICVLDQEDFESKMNLVLENLIHNSLEAQAQKLVLQILVNERDQLVLIVDDNGSGVSQEVLDELTASGGTSLQGGGTGLIASRNTIQSLGANFIIESKDGKGTRVTIEFVSYAA